MSTPSLDPDDPRLTAYALGELDDSSDQEAVERLMESSPEARAEVEQIRVLSRALIAEYDRERADYLIGRHPVPQPANVIIFPTAAQRRWRKVSGPLLKVAAILVILAGLAAGGISVSHRTSSQPAQAVAAPRPRKARDAAPASPPPATDGSMLALNTPATPVLVDRMQTLDSVAQKRLLDEPKADAEATGGIAAPAAAPAAAQASSPMIALRPPVRTARTAPEVAALSSGALNAPSKDQAAFRGSLHLEQPAGEGSSSDLPSTQNAGAPPDTPAQDTSDVEKRLAASLVSIAGKNGRITTGVVIASNGLVLTAGFADSAADQGTYPVTLNTGKVYRGTVLSRLAASGLCVLKIEATGLSAVPFVTEDQVGNDPVVLVDRNKTTRQATLRREQKFQFAVTSATVRAKPSLVTDPFEIVFDFAGNLLGFRSSGSSPVSKTAAKNPPAFQFLSVSDQKTLTLLLKDNPR